MPIGVRGLNEFIRNLKKIDSDLPKTVRLAMNKGAQTIVDDAQPRVPSRTGRARGTVRVASTQKKVRVRAGGSKARYYPWLDFGGRTGRKRSVKRPFMREGRYIYEAYYRTEASGELLHTMTEALLQVVEDAGIVAGGQ